MSDLLSMVLTEPVRADYNIYRYTDEIYKVVRFKSTAPRMRPLMKKERASSDKKLDAALSRARRVVLELALCNDWKYFCTFTISSVNFDRKDLVAWHDKFGQWLRDQRKKYIKLGYEFDISYVLVPEQHENGSWHMHGLFSDITPVLTSFRDLCDRGENIPWKLVKNGYFNWPDYQKKFGFCSFGEIRNKVAAGFYVAKYINKQLEDSCLGVGLHLYYPSRGLNRSTFHGDVYGHCSYLDKLLTNHYDFCSTGMTAVKDGCSWDFAFEYMDYDMLEAFAISDAAEEPEVDEYFNVTQTVIAGFR